MTFQEFRFLVICEDVEQRPNGSATIKDVVSGIQLQLGSLPTHIDMFAVVGVILLREMKGQRLVLQR